MPKRPAVRLALRRRPLTKDYLPQELLPQLKNVADFARVLVLDKWTSNADGRQGIFWRETPPSRRYHVTFVDQGYCFNAGEWSFPDSPLRGAGQKEAFFSGACNDNVVFLAFQALLQGAGNFCFIFDNKNSQGFTPAIVSVRGMSDD